MHPRTRHPLLDEEVRMQEEGDPVRGQVGVVGEKSENRKELAQVMEEGREQLVPRSVLRRE